MAKLFNGSIDVNKIDKSLIKSTDKNGQPFQNGAKYLNVSIWVNDEPDQYGNHVSISIGGKDNRKYIGNAKLYQPQQQTQQAPQQPNNSFYNPNATADDLPF